MSIKNISIGGALTMFIGAILFSAKAIMVKICYRYGIDAASLLALRMLFSFPFFAVVAVYGFINLKSSATSPKILTSDWVKLIMLGIVGYYLASIFDFEGLKYVSAGVERLILFIYPTLVVLISVVLYKRKLRTIEIVALGLTYSGVGLVFWHDVSGQGNNMALGAFFVFLSALTYAIYLVGSGNLIPKFGAMYYTSCAMLVSTVATTLHHWVSSSQSLWGFPAQLYYVVVAMAIFSTVIPGFMVSAAIKMIGASRASIIASVGPVSTILLAYLFLGEGFSLFQLLGTLLVLAGVIIVSLKK